MAPIRVAVLDDVHQVFDSDPAVARLRKRVPVDVFTEKPGSLEELRPYRVLVALRERTRFDAAFFEALPSLELIAQTGNHAYHVDLDAATRAGVLVAMGSSDMASMSGMAASTVELTFGLMLAVLRRISEMDRAIREHRWPSVLGYTLRGRRLGVLGLGRIGSEVARIALAFGMDVVAWGPTLTVERAAAAGVAKMDLDPLLEAADIVSVHLRLSEDSRGLLDERRLRRIGAHSVLINTARGAIVDQDALVGVLADGALGGAGLDVFAEEPLPDGAALRRFDNVVLTPHLGWIADLTYRRMAEAVVRIVEGYLDGTWDRAINPEAVARRPAT